MADVIPVGEWDVMAVDEARHPRPTQPSVTSEQHLSSPAGHFLVASGIAKSFGSVEVLTGVDLAIRPGEVVALAGENGAGKSTLLNIIAGLLESDEGRIVVDGVPRTRSSAKDAHEAGISIIPQELAPVPDLSVYENIFLGREMKTRVGTLDRPRMIAEAKRVLLDMQLDLNPRSTMRRLSAASQQLVEIVKNASTGCRALLLDEPTSALNQQETEYLYRVIADLSSRGVAMIYTTHKMAEIRAIADRVVVLRDGYLVTDQPLQSISDDEIVRAMIGRELGRLYPPSTPARDEEPALVASGVRISPEGPSTTLQIRPGEIVALAGLRGAGRTELLEAMFGLRARYGGPVSVGGKEIPRSSPTRSIELGLAFVPEDRKRAGVVTSMSVFANGYLPRMRLFSTAGWVRRGAAKAAVTAAMTSVHLKYKDLDQEVLRLSGGNQQKVVIGRWLTGHVSVLLLDEPTRGVDVGARAEIYRLIVQLAAAEGLAVLLASSDMAEVIGLAHRILVMRGGAVVGDLENDRAPRLQETIFRMATGLAV